MSLVSLLHAKCRKILVGCMLMLPQHSACHNLALCRLYLQSQTSNEAVCGLCGEHMLYDMASRTSMGPNHHSLFIIYFHIVRYCLGVKSAVTLQTF